MSRMFLRVAKVGGSLFDFADLPMALRCWLDSQPGVNVLIAGGGPFADAVRQADATFAIGDTTAHRLAMFSNQLASLMTHERIETTISKAKELLQRVRLAREPACAAATKAIADLEVERKLARSQCDHYQGPEHSGAADAYRLSPPAGDPGRWWVDRQRMTHRA